MKILKNSILGLQMLFVAFGATVLVPLLIGIDPAVALFTAGVGTLIFHLITNRNVPVFLGSSFIFIAPIVAGTAMFGYQGVLSGLIASGILFLLVAFIIKKKGIKFIEKVFPPIVIGPIIMIIGLTLSTTAIDMAKTHWLVAAVSLLSAILISVFGNKTFRLLPIIGGIVIGYLFAITLGIVDFSILATKPFFTIPNFIAPKFNLKAILYILPVAIAPIIEHIGDMYAISKATGKNFIKKPGIFRTLSGDGLATIFAGFFGGPPNTTYSEVTGAITLLKLKNAKILEISAVFAIVFAFIGKISGLLQTIPQAVLGGIMILVFGMIINIGIKSLIDNKVNLNNTKNMVIIAVMLTIGVGGAVISYNNFTLEGIGLSAIIGITLNLLLKNKKTN